MNEQPHLTDREWQLILALLESERRELPSEIRHTDSLQVRAELEQRLKLIDSLIERLHVQPVN